MPVSRSSLPALLSVLDRADAVATLTRDQLLASVNALDTPHSEQALEAAVDWHLAQAVPAVAPPATPYKFPWKRPKTVVERDRRLKHWGWLDYWNNPWVRRLFTVTSFVTCSWLSIVVLHDWLALEQTRSQAQHIWLHSIVGGLLVGFPVTGLLWNLVDSFVVPVYERNLPLTGNLARQAEIYLRYGTTRAYLRAVMSSGIPDLLEGDGEFLEDIYVKTREEEQEHKRRRSIEEYQAQKDIILCGERETRMAQFAAGLSEETT